LLTHLPPQSTWPLGQSPSVEELAQTQVSGSSVWPSGQLVAGHSQVQVEVFGTLGEVQGMVGSQTHCPPLHTLPLPHALPQVPQLVAVVLATQVPPQQIWPGPQAGLFATAWQAPPTHV